MINKILNFIFENRRFEFREIYILDIKKNNIVFNII